MTCANHPDRERTAFCQNCGKPLCPECTRTVGTAVFCEPCLAARLAGTGAPTGTAPDSSGFVPGPDAYGGYRYTPTSGEPNPGLAALLGFIPGVGAMYNGQYAKGVVHLIVFAILVSLADEHGVFGIFIAGWVIYQVIEAHHTARARRDGTPLPNPFGLNDLGERLGFGKSWPNATGTSGAASQQAAASTTPPAPSSYPPPSAAYPPQPGVQSGTANWSTPWDNSYSYVPPVPPIPPYGAPAYPLDPSLAPIPRNRFPAGAIWLIGLGCLFLIGNAGLFHTFPAHWFIPILLIGFGVWIFVRKMTDTGSSFADDGTPGYQFRLFRALRGSVWIILIGVLFLLDTSGVLSWHNSWPVIIIVAGLMAIFHRASFSSAMASQYPYPAPPAPPPPTSDPGSSIVPSTQHDEEGR